MNEKELDFISDLKAFLIRHDVELKIIALTGERVFVSSDNKIFLTIGAIERNINEGVK